MQKLVIQDQEFPDRFFKSWFAEGEWLVEEVDTEHVSMYPGDAFSPMIIHPLWEKETNHLILVREAWEKNHQDRGMVLKAFNEKETYTIFPKVFVNKKIRTPIRLPETNKKRFQKEFHFGKVVDLSHERGTATVQLYETISSTISCATQLIDGQQQHQVFFPKWETQSTLIEVSSKRLIRVDEDYHTQSFIISEDGEKQHVNLYSGRLPDCNCIGSSLSNHHLY